MSSSPRLVVTNDPAQIVRTELLDGLKRGRWPAGSRLPTERRLCADFGVSRSALRRVLQELRDLGLIEQKVGSGTYVTEGAANAKDVQEFEPSRISPAEIMEARLLLEPMLV